MSIGIVSKNRLSATNYAVSKQLKDWIYCKTGLERVSEIIITQCWLQNLDAGKIQRNLAINTNLAHQKWRLLG